MSFKCFLAIAKRLFRNPIKSLSCSIFSNQFSAVNYFRKKAPSWIFKWVLNKPWAIMSEAYLEHSQKSMVECFCKNISFSF